MEFTDKANLQEYTTKLVDKLKDLFATDEDIINYNLNTMRLIGRHYGYVDPMKTDLQSMNSGTKIVVDIENEVTGFLTSGDSSSSGRGIFEKTASDIVDFLIESGDGKAYVVYSGRWTLSTDAVVVSKVATTNDLTALGVTPMMYGAKGNGTGNDRDAIQACLDANPGGTIVFPAGVYNIGSTLELFDHTAGQTLYLGNAVLKWIGEDDKESVMMTIKKSKSGTPTYTQVRIYGGTFDGNKRAGTCIINNAFYAEIAGCRFHDYRYAGLINGDPDRVVANLIQRPYRQQSVDGNPYTANGLIFTVNDAGDITVTGTASDTTYYQIIGWTRNDATYPVIEIDPEFHYTLSGCPEGGSASTYSFNGRVTEPGYEPSSSGDGGTGKFDYGDGVVIYGYQYVEARIRIAAGYSCPNDGLVFHPMLERGTIKHSSTANNAWSLQAKIHDCHFMQGEWSGWNYSEQDTRGIICYSPDSQFSNIVTNRLRWAYEMIFGGNSFVNCHSTVDFRDWTNLTDEVWSKAGHILINPPNSANTQENLFTNCYFNIGKYVVFSKLQSRMCTSLTASHYTFYTSAKKIHFANAKAILCGGKPTDFRCSNVDIVVGANLDVLDYFPTAMPTYLTTPDKLEINSNDRHPEASVLAAYNLQPETYLTPVVNESVPAVIGTIYEIGAILLCYVPEDTSSIRTGVVKIGAYNGGAFMDCAITFMRVGTDLVPVVTASEISGTFNALVLYIARNPSQVTIEGITYNYYPIYLKKTAYTNYREFVYLDNNNPYTKCYMRNVISPAHTVADDTGLIRFPHGRDYKKILLIGDSYGVGYSPDGMNSGWCGYLASYLPTRGWDAYNGAVSGNGFVLRPDSTKEQKSFLQQIQAFIDSTFTDVVICGGFNDNDDTEATTRSAVQDTVAWIKSNYPMARVYVGCCGFSTNSTQENNIQTKVVPAYESIVRYGGKYLHVEDVLNASLMSSDGFHPTADGNIKLAEAILNELL